MEEYSPQKIDKKWQKYWEENKTFSSEVNINKPKFYVLDMFPYPSGSGLHVGHPLGYIASDIYARYKRLLGFNVLHPMGYDSFGLPAEQYAIQTGQHPAVTTKTNIEGGVDNEGNKIIGYRKQLDKIGFSFDWDREIRTSEPDYYQWTQWIFKEIFNCWYNNESQKAEKIEILVEHFEKEGNTKINAATNYDKKFTSLDWKSFSEEEKQEILLEYRLAYLSNTWVNWCPELGTVLANDEVKNGVSERGGYPVEQKKMRQWSMRITAYADRLLKGLDNIDWTDAIKDTQRNWIGKSQGASIYFKTNGDKKHTIEVFTTRPDTIFGVSFIVLAPEHELVQKITTKNQEKEIKNYQNTSRLKTERERISNVKITTGAFTGAYAIHPFTNKKIPIWIGDYVLANYGTGAVMSVPCGDQRDWEFAKHFSLEIPNVFKDKNLSKGAFTEKDAVITNSDFLDGLTVEKATKLAIFHIEQKGYGKGKTQYKIRDAVFSRQRYWGEPFPVYYKGKTPYTLNKEKLVKLPDVDKYLPTALGEPPLARAKKESWGFEHPGDRMEYNTMPGWAGSSWYFLRFMDSKNQKEFVNREKANYWQNVDLYVGGAEHATGHLLYSRFWTKILYDLDYIPFNEPFKKLINQGMIQGNSRFVYKLKREPNNQSNPIYFSKSIVEDPDKRKVESIEHFKEKLKNTSLYTENKKTVNLLYEALQTQVSKLHVDINLVSGHELNVNAFKKSRKEYNNAEFVLEDEKFICPGEVEKMSKSKYNVQTPDTLVEKFGADTLRCYEMFLGPLEQHKPWDIQGITGVEGFLKKLWRLFHENNKLYVSDQEPTKEELKAIHKAIKKTQEDLERYSFNTPVSIFMICVNELSALKCNKKAILSDLCLIISPYAPHICEELWQKLGNKESISFAKFPKYNPKHLVENSHKYPVSFNGKMRFILELPVNISKEETVKEVLKNEKTLKYLEGKTPKKIIVVPRKIVNIVL
jgi:leucyl-tRNA synthetase